MALERYQIQNSFLDPMLSNGSYNYSISGGHLLICKNYREIQQWFLAHMPNFVQNIFLIAFNENDDLYDRVEYTYGDYVSYSNIINTENLQDDGGGTANFNFNSTSSMSSDGLSFYDGENHIFVLYRTKNNTGYGVPGYTTSFTFRTLGENIHRVRLGCTYGNEVHRFQLNSSLNGSLPFASIIKEIIKINENTVAFTFGHIHSKNPHFLSPGIVILTKSNEGNITLICPSRALVSSSTYKTRSNSNIITNSNNYLLVASKNSATNPYYYETIPYQSVYGDKTILNPIIIPGCNEYCPTCFYTPVCQYILDNEYDTIISINNKPYYYNGFIAIELDE